MNIIELAKEAGFKTKVLNSIDGEEVLCFDPVITDMLKDFAALVAAHEREAIMDEWWMCVDSDLENGVKSLNERAAKKWHEEYPAISGFGETIRARSEK
jgi:hypothetical protein